MIPFIIASIVAVVILAVVAIAIDNNPTELDLMISEVVCPTNEANKFTVYPVDPEAKSYYCITSCTFKNYILLGTRDGEPTVLLKRKDKTLENVFNSDLPNPNAAITALVNVDNQYILAARSDGLWKMIWNGSMFVCERIKAANSEDFGNVTTLGLVVSIDSETIYSSFIPHPEGIIIKQTLNKKQYSVIDGQALQSYTRVALNANPPVKYIEQNNFPLATIRYSKMLNSVESTDKIPDVKMPLESPKPTQSRTVDALFDRHIEADEPVNRTIARTETVDKIRQMVKITSSYVPPKRHYYKIYVTAVNPMNPRELPFDQISAFMGGEMPSFAAINLREGVPSQVSNLKPTDSAWILMHNPKPFSHRNIYISPIKGCIQVVV